MKMFKNMFLFLQMRVLFRILNEDFRIQQLKN
jgi:hypothetical protein